MIFLWMFGSLEEPEYMLTSLRSYKTVTCSEISLILSSLVATFVICLANSLNPDQAQHFVGPDLDPNCLYSDGIPERFFF